VPDVEFQVRPLGESTCGQRRPGNSSYHITLVKGDALVVIRKTSTGGSQVTFSGPTVNWKKYYDRLRTFRTSEADGDRGRFPAPNASAIVLAHSFLQYLQGANYPPAQVMPSVVGGVGFAFRRSGRKVYVEFNNKAAVHALFSDGVSDPVVQRVRPEEAGYQQWMAKAKAYLDE